MKLIDVRNAQGVLKTIETKSTTLDKLVERAEMVGYWLYTQQNMDSNAITYKNIHTDIVIFNERVGNARNIISVNCVGKTINKTQKRYSGLGDIESKEVTDTLTHAEFLEWFVNTSKEKLYPLPSLKIGRVIKIKHYKENRYIDCLIVGSFNNGIKYVLLDLTTSMEFGSYESLEQIEEQTEIVEMWSSLKEYWTC